VPTITGSRYITRPERARSDYLQDFSIPGEVRNNHFGAIPAHDGNENVQMAVLMELELYLLHLFYMVKNKLNKRVVFTVCTGRCGTQLLTERLAELPGITSLHEPDPNFVDIFQRVKKDPTEAINFWIEIKLPAIARTSNPIYVETSHLFCKGFLDGLLYLGIIPDIIILSRDHRAVASSLHRLGCIPSRNTLGREWLLGPDDKGVLKLGNWTELNDYQLCYWYCLEIERRQVEVEKKINSLGGRVVRTSLNEIRTALGMLDLINRLDLIKPSIYTRIKWSITSYKRVNTKKWATLKRIPNEILDQQEEEVKKRITLTN